ncbi:double-strand break repair protein AddB [Cereibacter sphaeroides]|uniref:double-strand break repair protein AddB n=1 Tax=Cereibacter sphaeroides TaxID=1063 RepID=UPI001F1C6006|nr:double-strand break repair protein AddB [Cereibacter sphaeroides]MCE6952525.1 double-strand break repair protein AddB [Cereibacter sphaeroides]
MFDSPGPHLFGLPPGVDFPAALVAGLRARLADAPPEAMARVELYVNTQRMRRRITELMTAEGAGFLPRIRLVTELPPVPGLPAPVPALRRRLELAQLVARLIEAQPDLAPRSALFDLADSLAELIDEMQGEGVAPEAISRLDVADHSAHWQRTQAFMSIVAPMFGSDAPDAQALARMTVERLAARWHEAPPRHPVIVAGSTGSRGTTALFMQAVARLPQGALVLPGFDFDLPAAVWAGLDDALTAEDHPQFRFHRLLGMLDATPSDVRRWSSDAAPSPGRNRLISLSLRPAPVTDQWLTEGKLLPDLSGAAEAMTLIEAPGPRAEALAVALILRRAAEEGRRAALITSDRELTRQVAAALDRWGIVPDDSAGRPLALSAPGRLLRHVARLFGRRLTGEALLTLLKHPLTATGSDRGNHLRWTRDLELQLRRRGPPFPTGADLAAWAAGRPADGVADWAAWLGQLIEGLEAVRIRPLAEHVAAHLALTEALAAGPSRVGTGELWLKEAGEAALAAVTDLRREAPHGGELTPADYTDLFDAILARGEVREAVQAHPGLMIWGTLEARVQGAELVILGGLNDGTWPQLPPPDPWLNRQMRLKAGLLLPERRIGLAAHDYQQAVGAPEVVLTRAVRNAEAETVPSRWLNRLTNLMSGLPAQGGPQALAAMRRRGQEWLALAQALEAPGEAVPLARRPAPRPPVEVRPRQLAVTGIRTLIRDPYAIYARHILRLRPLDPLHRAPDARLRGSILHRILEDFVKGRPEATDRAAERARLMTIAGTVLADEVPWPAARALWLARLDRAADFFLEAEAAQGGSPVVLEEEGRAELAALGFTLTAKPDRIDVLPDGRLHILDYKTGTPPTKKQQEQFDKQLLLEAAMAERGAFRGLEVAEVARISYIGLGSSPKIEAVETDAALLGQVWEGLHALVGRYMVRSQGYASRRAMFGERFPGDYDHLARFGEWEMSDPPEPETVGAEGQAAGTGPDEETPAARRPLAQPAPEEAE